VLLFSAEVSALEKAAPCQACHGSNGVSQTVLTPSIAGQPSFYLVAQLFLFREGRRDNAAMNAAAKDLRDADLQALADFFASLPPPRASGKADAAKAKRGRAVVARENCANCHGAGFEGDNNVPRLAGQREDYLLKALRDYKAGRRVGYGNAVMPETVANLRDAELAAAAHFLAYGYRSVRETSSK
jgi:cytochrome c553